MKKLIILISALFITIIQAQSQTDSKSIIQNAVNSTAAKSPDAAALFRYTETPVSLYTGVPDISIPIFTIKEGDIELPISISYHAGGIKVNDEASSIGLGWNLNAGGRVSHVVAGANDFSINGYYNTYPKNAIGSAGSVAVCPILPWNTSTQTNAFYSNFFVSFMSGFGFIYINDDFQPDQFLINLPHTAYKAYLDMSKTTKTDYPKFAIAGQPNINFKIIPSSGFQPGAYGDYKFQVTDEKGINYSYEKGETSRSLIGQYSIDGLSRFLTKIEDIKGNQVNFYYSATTVNDRLSGCKNIRTDYTYDTNVNLGYLKENGLTECSKLKVDESFLEKIEFSNGKIEFVWTEREDVANSKKLSSVKIFNKYKLIQQYDFNYDYFVATDNLDTSPLALWLGANNNKIFTHRLRLLNLTESIKNEKYSFEYNSIYNLPNKLSFSTDFWGYYNGQNNSDTFIPNPTKYLKGENVFNVTSFKRNQAEYWYEETFASPTFNPNDGGIKIYKDFSSDGKHYLSDRRASLYSLAGMLTTINHPTGGKTEYEYEPNTFSNFPMQSLINDNTRKELNGSQNINIVNGGLIHSGGINEFNVIGNNIKLNINAKFNFYYQFSANAIIQSFWIYIKDKSTGQIVKKIYNPNVGSYQTSEVTDSILLQSGNYEIGTSYTNDFIAGNIQQPNNSTIINNSYHIDYVNEKSIINNVEYNYSSGGGIRIKSIKSTEKVGAVPIVKNYIYDEVSNNGTKITSNGNLADFPKFFEIENRCYNWFQGGSAPGWLSNPTCVMNFNTPQSPNNYPFKISVYEATPGQGTSTLPQGNHIGYSKVIEQVTGQGRTESYFVNDYNQSCIMMAQRGTSLIVGDGDLLKQKIYDNSNNLIKEISYNYKFNYPDNLNTYFIAASILEPLSNFRIPPMTNDASFPGIIHNYSINLYKSLLESTTTKEYIQTGSGNFVETKSFTTYNNKYQPSIQKTIYPDTSISETTYNYAQEKGNQLLLSKNMVGIPLETIVTQTNNGVTKTLSKTETVYPTSLPDAQIGNFILPKSIKTYDLSNSSSSFTEVTLDKYDVKGNLIQYTAKDGTPISIIWGYNSRLPIAKIEGALYDNIAMYVNDIMAASNTDTLNPTNEQTLLNAEDNLRKNTNLANYQITTYTHDPLIGVTSIAPPSGVKEYYKYDTTNRLEKIVDINNKIIKEFKYKYATSSSVTFSNIEKSEIFTRNNCSGGIVGGSYTYTVPAGTYLSDTSQLAADQKALDDINTNGQNVANLNGSCTPVVSCSFTFSSMVGNPQYSNNSTGTINNNVNFNVSFSGYGIWQNWSNGVNIGKVGPACVPSVNRQITYTETSFNRQWKIFIDTVGNCTVTLLSGTVDASSTNPLNFFFQYQK